MKNTPISFCKLKHDDDDGDDEDDDDDEFCFVEWLTDERCYFQPGPLSKILTIPNLTQTASRV